MNNKLSLLVNFVGVDKMSGALRNIVGLGKKGSTSLKALRGEGRRLETQLANVRRQMAGASGNITQLINRERELENAISGVNRQLDRQKRLSAIESNKRAMIAKGEDMKQRGQDHVIQGATLAAPLILATKEAAEFSSGMVDIQQKAGLTNKRTDQLAASILTMSRNAKQMPEAIRAGLDLLLAKGMDLDAATAAIGPAGRLATAYKVDIPDAAGAAYASINNLKVASSQAALVFDAMAAAGNEGGFEVRDMARHFPALTAQMQALGEKGVPAVADLSAALQVAMHTAGNADEAGNNIKNLLAKINAPGTIRAFEKNFGVNLPAAMKKLTDEGMSSMEAIALITKQATGGDMKKLGFAFEDMQARQGIMALIQNLEEYRRVRDAAMKSGGTVDKAFDQRVARDAMVNWNAFKASVSQLAITLGATLLPVATAAMDMISNLASSIGSWARENPVAAATLTKLVAGLAVFKIGMGAAMMVIGTAMGPFAKFAAVMQRFPIIRSILGGLGNTLLAFGKIALRAGLMLLTNPLFLIPVLIAGAAYLIYTHWDSIKAAFWKGVAGVGQAWEGFKGMLSAGLAWFVGLHVRFAQIGANIIRGIGDGIRNGAAAVWNALKGVVLGGIERVKNFLGIKSPSRVFMAIGQYASEGLAIGIDRRARSAVGAAGRLAAGVTAAGSLALAPVGATAQPMARAGADTNPVGASSGITINVYQQPGEDGEALARRVMQMIEQKQNVSARRSYEDET